MEIETREYAEGTCLTQQFPWGTFLTGKALCTDGKNGHLLARKVAS